MHVLGQWEEAEVPGENPCTHKETFKLHIERPQLAFEPGTLLL